MRRLPDAACGGAMTAAHGALDRSGQPGVDPVAGQQKARAPAVSVAGRAGWPGASENVARGSRIDGRAQQRAPRARPAARRAARRAPARSARRSSARRSPPRRSRPATDATRSSPNDEPLVEHPLHRAAGQADERLVEHAADRTRGSPSRSATTPSRARASSDRRAAAAASPSNSSASANHGTAEMTRAGVQSLAAGAHAGDARRRRRQHASPSRRCAPSPPWRSMYARAGSAYIWCSGLRRQHDRRGARIGAEHLGEHARERRRRRLSGGWLSAASASGSHSISRSRARLAVADQPVLDRLARRRRHRRSRPSQLAARDAAAASPSPAPTADRASDSASQSSTPASRCSGGGSAGQLEPRSAGRARSIIVTPAAAASRTLSRAPMSRRNANVSV